MEIDINGDPGTGNHFDDVHIQQVDNYSPNAKQAIFNTIHQDKAESRLACWFRKLNDEFEKDNKLKKKFDDIRRYKTKLPHTIGLDQKLKDGGFSDKAIEKARRLKQYFAKKSTKFQYYESAQRIDSYLFAKVCSSFDTYVMPLIEQATHLTDIKRAVYEQVILPIMNELNENGAADACLCYNEDDIYGMLYYLTGNCHINWTDYDV